MSTFCLKVWGDFACFTRPEMKVERVSYDVMTPSAARGVLEAILWKPAIRWVVTRIDVLQPIKWFSIRRNEVSFKAQGKAKYIEDNRQQRAALVLCNTAYLIHARFDMVKPGPADSEGKFLGMFERRATNGQCFHRPYLGCREFPAQFELISQEAPLPQPIEETRELGWVLYDLDYSKKEPTPRFFRAKLQAGVVCIPPWNSEEVKG